MKEGETYLGDAIYASLVNGMIKLRCPAMSAPDAIYMEPEVLAAFMRFIAAINRGEIQEQE